MRMNRFRGSVIILLAIMMNCWALPSLAENGQDFAGVFSITDMVDAVDEVTVSLSLKIFNNSGADVTNATVGIEQFPPGAPLYEFPSHVDIDYGAHITVTEPVLVIPRTVYEHWGQGAIPLVTLRHFDEEGNQRSTVVDLLPPNMNMEVRS